MSSVFATLLFYIINSAEFLIRIVFIFNFCFLCGEFVKFLFLNNFLHHIFTSSCLFLMFKFHVSKIHSISRYICHERCVFVVEFKKPRSLFSDRR